MNETPTELSISSTPTSLPFWTNITKGLFFCFVFPIWGNILDIFAFTINYHCNHTCTALKRKIALFIASERVVFLYALLLLFFKSTIFEIRILSVFRICFQCIRGFPKDVLCPASMTVSAEIEFDVYFVQLVTKAIKSLLSLTILIEKKIK